MNILLWYFKKYILFLIYRPKHPSKVHVWAGISKRGSTGICIFDGIMVSTLQF